MRRILHSFVPFLAFFLLVSAFLIWAHFLIEEKSQTELIVQVQDNSPENDTDEASSQILAALFMLPANLEQSDSQTTRELFYSTNNLINNPKTFTAKQTNDLFAQSMRLKQYKEAAKIAPYLQQLQKSKELNQIEVSMLNYNLGLLALRAKEYEKALPLFQTGQRYDKSYLIHLARAVTLIHLKDTVEPAINSLTKALAQAPETELAKIHFKIGSEYGKVDEYQNALQSYEEALSIDPSLYLTSLNQAIIYRKLKDYDTSERIYAELITKHPSFFKAAYNYAIMLEHAKRPKDAEKAYMNALLLNKDHMRLREKIGWIYYRKKQFDKALVHYSWLSRKSSSNSYYILMNARITLQMGQVEPAFKLFHLAIQKDGGEYEKGWIELGDALIANNKPEEGLNAYKSALTLNPKNTDALGRMAKYEARKGNTQAALKIYRQALAINPEAGLFLRRIGQIYYALKDYPKAIQFLARSIEKVNYPLRSHILLGEVYTKNKEYLNALENYEIALNISPKDDALWLAYGKLHASMKRYPSSLDAYNQALNLSELEDFIFRAKVYASIAKTEAGQLKFQKAKQSLLTALELDSASFQARIQLSHLQFYHLKDKTGAIKEIKLALGLKPDSCQALKLANNYQLSEFTDLWKKKCNM